MSTDGDHGVGSGRQRSKTAGAPGEGGGLGRVVSFGARLRAATDARGALCVGIDPHPALLRAWGVGEDAGGLEMFSRTVVDALADRIAVLKPQSAFYERLGSPGIAVLERTVRAAREAGALVLLDAKRGDIGSTAVAYAQAYLNPASPLAVDALTVSPFLGVGSLEPVVDAAARYRAGVFVLALTSNPEGPALQHAVRADGRTVARSIRDYVAAANAAAGHDQASPLGHVGLVVGATVDPEAAASLDLTGLGGPVLAPGLGAQGASAQDLARVFWPARASLLPTTSRDVLAAGPTPAGLREAAARTLAACAAALA